MSIFPQGPITLLRLEYRFMDFRNFRSDFRDFKVFRPDFKDITDFKY